MKVNIPALIERNALNQRYKISLIGAETSDLMTVLDSDLKILSGKYTNNASIKQILNKGGYPVALFALWSTENTDVEKRLFATWMAARVLEITSIGKFENTEILSNAIIKTVDYCLNSHNAEYLKQANDDARQAVKPLMENTGALKPIILLGFEIALDITNDSAYGALTNAAKTMDTFMKILPKPMDYALTELRKKALLEICNTSKEIGKRYQTMQKLSLVKQ